MKPRPDAAGVMALDTELEESLKSYEVSFALLPLITKAQPKPAGNTPSDHQAGKLQPPYSADKGGKPFNNKCKGKGKPRFEQRIPREIREAGGTAATPDGAPICFDYAFKRCKESVPDGSRCKKGYHLCSVCCYGPHSMADHKKA